MIAEIVVSIFLVIGGVFGLVGSFGMLKLQDTMQKLHAPTKAATLGVGGVLLAAMMHSLLVKGYVSFHELLITLFLFLTAPISGHFIAKVYMTRHLKAKDLPATGGAFGWSGYDDPPSEAQRPTTTAAAKTSAKKKA